MDQIKIYTDKQFKKRDLENERNELNGKLQKINTLLLTETEPYIIEAHEKQKTIIQTRLNEISSDINDINDYLLKNKRTVGTEIMEYMTLMAEEIQEYLAPNANRKIETLKDKLDIIDEYKKEIYNLLCILEDEEETKKHISDKNSKNDTAKEERIKIPLSLLQNSQSISSKEFFILPQNLEFSNYQHNRKDGFSLQNFIVDQGAHIKTVLDYFNYDFDRTIQYLQQKHGLASGSAINMNTFKQKITSTLHLSIKQKMKVILNGMIVEGSDNNEIFYNFLAKISLSDLLSKYPEVISTSSLNISAKPFLKEDVPDYINIELVREIKDKNGKTFYCYHRLSDQRKVKHIKQIAAKLNLNIQAQE